MSKKSQKQKEQLEVKAEAPEIEGKNFAEAANEALAERAKTEQLVANLKTEIRMCREDIKDVKHQMEVEIQYLSQVCKTLSEELESFRGAPKPVRKSVFEHEPNQVTAEVPLELNLPKGFRGRN